MRINEHSAIAVEGVHQISSKNELFTKAGLDFEVEQVNLGDATGDDGFKRFYGLRNSRTKDVYTVTGKKYTPIQNEELINAFDEVRKLSYLKIIPLSYLTVKVIKLTQ